MDVDKVVREHYFKNPVFSRVARRAEFSLKTYISELKWIVLVNLGL
jgi:hypothetical protein